MNTKNKRTERARLVGALTLQTWVGVQPVWTLLSMWAPEKILPIALYVAVAPAAGFAYVAHKRKFHGAATVAGLSVFAFASAPFGAGEVVHLQQVAALSGSHKFAVSTLLWTLYGITRGPIFANWTKGLTRRAVAEVARVLREQIENPKPHKGNKGKD